MNWEIEYLTKGDYSYPKKITKENALWLYTIEPVIRPKHPDPVLFVFSGWTRTPHNFKRMNIEGSATTMEECEKICQCHNSYVSSIKNFEDE